MSTTNPQHTEFLTCELCKRRYNVDVYKRHINENQCIKRNQHRLPFESIKQRSIRIGDKIFSIQEQKQQQQQQQTNNDVQISNSREKKKQPLPNINNNKQYQEKFQRILPSNNHRQRLEQAKQLLERRTKYKPPWILRQDNFINDLQLKPNRTSTSLFQTKDISNKIKNRSHSPRKSKENLYSRTRPSPPTTKFKHDALPIKVSDRSKHDYHHIPCQQPILTHSPKIRIPQVLTASKIQHYQLPEMDQTFSHEPINSGHQSMRKANTWTRSSKPSSSHGAISPIRIPTFRDSSAGPFHDSVVMPTNQNYEDIDDEFEIYSPTPPSTPKYQYDRKEIKAIPSSVKQNFTLDEQQTFIRPVTYKKVERFERQQKNDIPKARYLTRFLRNRSPRKTVQSTVHLPPINSSSSARTHHSPRFNRVPWR
ncbi:unnamed protein product [Rotaria magnacalcarata]|uniref:Uncharacterized protein n=2 Tax=Rotaria magnacalcarata TaxID=392030 RepID=A0A815XUR8_9BILA|nr:unnamed protein product [Rotaria magnacalcarata]